MAKTEKKLTIGDLKKVCKELNIGDDFVIILSSDEEGNSFSPLMRFKGGMLNLGVEAEKKEVILYPSSAHEIGW